MSHVAPPELEEHALYYSPSLGVLKEIVKQRVPTAHGADGAARGAQGARHPALFAVANQRVDGPAQA